MESQVAAAETAPKKRRASKVFSATDYTLMPEPDERTVTIQICDIIQSGTGLEILETLHFLPKRPKRASVIKPMSAAWLGRAAEWAVQWMRARDAEEGITFRSRPGQRIKLTVNDVEYFFRVGSVRNGVRKARRESESSQMRML